MTTPDGRGQWTDKPRNPDRRSDWAHEPGVAQGAADAPALAGTHVVPVQVVGPVETTTGAVQKGFYVTWSIPASTGANPNVQKLLPADPLRQYGYVTAIDNAIVITTSAQQAGAAANLAPAGASAQNASGSSTPTLAAQVITGTSLTLAAGTYTVNWSLRLAGTATAAEANNTQLVLGAATEIVSQNTGATGAFPQISFQLTVPAGGAVLAAETVGVPSGTATYFVQLACIPAGGGGGPLSPSGAIVQAGETTPAIRHNEEVWAANPSTTQACRVSVLVETGTAAG